MKQLHIVTEDKPGVLAGITEALANASINIENCTAEQVGGSAVITLDVDRYDDALRALAHTPYNAISEDVVLVRVADRPGALAEIARRFHLAGINVRSLRLVSRSGTHAIAAISADRIDDARAVVKDLIIG